MAVMPHQDAIRTIIEEEDPALRIDAHLLLGQRALSRDDPEAAIHHFREAADLDPTDERPRTALLDLEGAKGRKLRAKTANKTSFWRWLFRSKKAEA